MYVLRQNIWKLTTIALLLLMVIGGILYVCRSYLLVRSFEITDELGGNIFPSTILSTATTDAEIIVPADSNYVGKPLSGVAVKVKSTYANTRVQINIAATPFFSESVSEFILSKPNTEYYIYPEFIWNYEALKNNAQSVPVTIAVKLILNKKEFSQKTKTYSMRSVNECPLGYMDSHNKFHDTSLYFAAYVNEEHPMIDQLLREALNARIVNRFTGYQGKVSQVDKQVYALWYVLQKRNFKYSSISNTSLSSNVVFAQRVRTVDDALEAAQINCVDGSVLFASLLKAININPILVRIPGHMFVGYYTDKSHKDINFLETTIIGDVNLDDFFPEEKLDSTMVGKSQYEMSRFTFEKSREYATNKYKENEEAIHSGQVNYMFLEISKETRAKVQPIGK